MTDIKEYPLVIIEWMDAQSDSDWTDMEKVGCELATIQTVGFIVSETRQGLAVASSLDTTNGAASMVMVIPKKWCVKITPLGSVEPVVNETMN